MKSFYILFAATWLFSFIATASPPVSSSTKNPLPFREGESLVYDISWMGILAGEGNLRVEKKIEHNESDILKISISSRSTGWVRKLHKVDDRTYTYFDIDKRHSHMADILISEGSYKKHKVITFDQKNNKATYKINENEPTEFDVAPNSQDALSSLFYLRTVRGKLVVGETIFIPLFDDKKKYTLDVKVLRKERINLPKGMVDTILVRPYLKSEGIFQRKGKLWVWLTDDEFLTPVMMRSKILVGSFYATMRESDGVEITYIPYKKKKEPKKQ